MPSTVYGIKDYNLLVLDANGNPTSTQGMITELNLPNLERTFDDDQRSAAMGKTSYAQGFDVLEASFTIKGITPALEDAIFGSVNGNVSFQISAVAEGDDGSILSYILVLRGKIMTLPTGGSLNPGENRESEVGMRCNYISRTFQTSTLVIDFINNQYIVNGVDLWAARRAILGV